MLRLLQRERIKGLLSGVSNNKTERQKRRTIMFEGITISGFADELDESLKEQISGFQKLGITHMEIRGVNGKGLTEYSLEEVRAFKKELDAAGIRCSAIGSPIGKIRITDEFEPHFELFCHTVEIARIMETKRIRMFSFYMPEGEEPEKYTQEVMRRLECMVQYAKEHDILLLHENEKGIYGDIASRCEEILKRFYCENFKAVFDFANFVQCGQDTLEAYEVMKPYIAYVHIKDALFRDKSVVPAGYGDGNVEKILGHLKDRGYQGVLSLEPHLAEFQGFARLEQAGEQQEKDEKSRKFSGEEIFEIAYGALRKILERL